MGMNFRGVAWKRPVGLPPRGGGGTPLYGLYRYVRRQREWFFSCLVINRVSILAILVINRDILALWFFLEEATSSS